MIKKNFLINFLIIAIIVLSSCNKTDNIPDLKNLTPEQEKNLIVIGTIAGPETELVEIAKNIAKDKYNLDVYIVQFNDYVEPNRALVENEINANLFQHQPYLDQVVQSQKLPLVSIGKLFIYPMGIYSEKYKSLDQAPNDAIVAVPNDTSNQARSLLLLQKAGLITLKSSKNINASLNDIETNPKKLKFEETDPAFMVRMLPDLDLAIINTNYAALAGLYPNKNALIAEDKKSPYANILVVNKKDKNNSKFQLFLKALRAPEVVKKAQELFHGQAVEAW